LALSEKEVVYLAPAHGGCKSTSVQLGSFSCRSANFGIEQTIMDATRRVTQWIIGVRGEVPLVEELATAEDVQSFVCGHVRWSDGTPGPAVEQEDIDWITVDWHFVLKVMHAVL